MYLLVCALMVAVSVLNIAIMATLTPGLVGGMFIFMAFTFVQAFQCVRFVDANVKAWLQTRLERKFFAK